MFSLLLSLAAQAEPAIKVRTVQDALEAVQKAHTEDRAAQGASPPTPVGNPGTWVTPADYPPTALREDIGGLVRFVLGVSVDGSVTDCTVRESSGDAALDNATCTLLKARARFEPATNARGEPTVGTWKSSVRWEIPDSSPIPPALALQYRFVVGKDGEVTKCEVIQAPVEAERKICNNISQRSYMPDVDDEGFKVSTEVTVTMKTEKRIIGD